MTRRPPTRLLALALAGCLALLALVLALTHEDSAPAAPAIGGSAELDVGAPALDAPDAPEARLAETMPPAAEAAGSAGAAEERALAGAAAETCRVEGVVRTADGVPAVGATVELALGDPWSASWRVETRAGEGGAFRLDYPRLDYARLGHASGPEIGAGLWLRAHRPGAAGALPVDLAADGPPPCTTRSDLVLAPGALAHGRVVDAQGRGAAATVELVRDDPAHGPVRAAETTSAADGRFVLRVAESGAHAVHASVRAGVRAAARRDGLVLDATRDADLGLLRLASASGRLAGRVVDPTGAGVGGVLLDVYSEAFGAAPGTFAEKAARVQREKLAAGRHHVLLPAGADGSFAVEGLVAGQRWLVEPDRRVHGPDARPQGPFPDGTEDARVVVERYRLVVRVAEVERRAGLAVRLESADGRSGQTRRVERLARAERPRSGVFAPASTAPTVAPSVAVAAEVVVTFEVTPGRWRCALVGVPELAADAWVTVAPGQWETECRLEPEPVAPAVLVLDLVAPPGTGAAGAVEVTVSARADWTTWRGSVQPGVSRRVPVAPGEHVVLCEPDPDRATAGEVLCARALVRAAAGVETRVALDLVPSGTLALELRAPEGTPPARAWLRRLLEPSLAVPTDAHPRGLRRALEPEAGSARELGAEPEPVSGSASDSSSGSASGSAAAEASTASPELFPANATSRVRRALAPGRYALRVDAPGCASVEREIEVAAGAETSVVLELVEAR